MILRYIVPTGDDGFGYWQALAEVWASDGPVINVEHDMQYSPTLADELLLCPHPLCTHAYRMHTPREYWAHSRDGMCGMDGTWISQGEQWAAWSAIGFCKIAPHLRSRPLERSSWRGLEAAVNWSIRVEDLQHKWHVHWPGVEHYHYPEP